ncbi:UNVERIFIED_CONTAM: hypothetical protein HDU68_009907 [Siphonaria sp. JEL0065]|nr:hypothetical protein HDU68_009907 [Siphonaria sp. JEL0065]
MPLAPFPVPPISTVPGDLQCQFSESAEAEDGDNFDADSDFDKAESCNQQQSVLPANILSPITRNSITPVSNSSQADSISGSSGIFSSSRNSNHCNSSRSSSVSRSSKSSISSIFQLDFYSKSGAKRSASPGLGERAKRAHKPLSQVAALTNTLDRALELMMAPQPVLPVAPVVPPLVLPESIQLTMVVAKK